MELKENVLEFLTGDKSFTFTFSNYSHINKMKKLHANNPEAFEYFQENTDGSICGRIPLKWLKISPPAKREYTEEQKAALSERMKQMQNKRVKKNSNEEV